jgi:hypothetical protein
MGFLILGDMGKTGYRQVVAHKGNPVLGKTTEKRMVFKGQRGDKGPAQGDRRQGPDDKKAPIAFPLVRTHIEYMAYFPDGDFPYRNVLCGDPKEVNTDAISGQGFKFCRMVTVICIPVMLIYIRIFQNKGDKVFEAVKEFFYMRKLFNIETAEIL